MGITKYLLKTALYGTIFTLGYTRGCSSAERRHAEESPVYHINRAVFESLDSDQKWNLVKHGIATETRGLLEEAGEVTEDAIEHFRETKLYDIITENH